MNLEKAIGDALGTVLGGFCYAGSAIRDARVFHPEGEDYVARVEQVAGGNSQTERLSQQLAGPALMRLSAGVWKGEREWPDVLGVALRFGWNRHAPLRTDGVQDLLLISSKRLWMLPAALVLTEVGDFLRNTYYSILSFQSEIGRIEFRLVPQPSSRPLGSVRSERLEKAVLRNEATFTLQTRTVSPSPAMRHSHFWRAVAVIELLERADVDDRQLLFTPFNAARGIRPLGTANQIRRLTYRSSKAGRS